MRWTAPRVEAAIAAINAMLAGEEGEGDAEGVSFDDLREARSCLHAERAKLRAPTPKTMLIPRKKG